jgi:hypothetical protein
MKLHPVSTKVPIDTPVGEEMVIHRSSRFPWKHDGVKEGQTIILHGYGPDVYGLVRKVATHILFRDIPEPDIQDGYYAAARTRETLLACLQGMYKDYGYYEDTPTTVIRCRRIK